MGGYYKQQWTPVGTKEHPFKGSFDGGSPVRIVNLYISATTSATDLGLFGYVEGGEIRNCNIYDCDIDINKPSNTTEGFNAGGICGYLTSVTTLGSITNCTISGSIGISDAKVLVSVGGIVGQVDKSAMVDHCVSYAQVLASNSTHPVTAGGICGIVNSGGGMSYITISNCFTEYCNTRAESDLSDASAGGIAGEFSGNNIKMNHCGAYLSHITAKGKQYSSAGGIVGSSSSESAQVTACYNLSDVSAHVTATDQYAGSYAGGICGSGMISIFTCENTGPIKEGKYRANMLGAGGGTISSCCATDASSNVYGIVGKVESATKISDCYYTSTIGAVGVGNATIADSYKFSADHWPTVSLKGWGSSAPAGWTGGDWSNPWDFIGDPGDQTKFPILKRLMD